MRVEAETQKKKIGMAAGIYLPPENPLSVGVVPNIKTQVACAKLNEELRLEWYRRIEKLPEHERRSARWIPYDRKKLFLEMERRGIRKPKRDAYGFPGGEIWDFEVLDNPATYAIVALLREFVEETGLIVKKQRIIGAPFFQEDRDRTSGGYENHFFHVSEAEGTLNTKGVEDETGPPEIKLITDLNPSIFYPKHAKMLMKLLVMLIGEGKNEYEEPLKHLQKVFTRLPEMSEKPNFKIETVDPALSEEDQFLAKMEQLKVKTK